MQQVCTVSGRIARSGFLGSFSLQHPQGVELLQSQCYKAVWWDLGVLALDWGQRLQLVHAQGQGLGQELRPWLRLQLQRNVVNVGGVRVGSCLLLLHCSVPSTYVPADLC